ncbi:MAG: hypothetical protein ACI8RZ_007422 [Myxococcota bacterium]|jgi:hypothetical protein
MKTKPTLDKDSTLNMDRIASGLGAERRGTVQATGGYFGAAQLVAEVQARFQAPPRGGRSTDPEWTERRLLPLAPETLHRLEQLSKVLGEQGVRVTPLQVAALLLERAVGDADDGELAELARRAS